ncbi:helix-turn-helix domain-containing protein [Paenibacillus mendelii]|uniref:Helix-turn-helix domain-containing protein n=1 Tax=Paenibacillus mendelii TaxID=206163 RepID=A0ABV6JCY6_9BACL|nr:helix-turn-helix domain-containing protein [Paenibacillus mendelii]MCQ6561650.1 helix-turn-helix domain-containing protein [Paenibacillus mendelii]
MKRWVELTKSKVFFLYVGSFLLVFFIPSVVLGGMMYQNAVINLQAEIESSNLHNLNQVKEMIDRQMKGLEQTAVKISYDHRLTPFFLRTNDYYAMEAVQELGKYKANTLIAEEVLLYYRDGDMIYTSSGTYSLDVLTREIYRLDDKGKEDLLDLVKESDQKAVRPAETVFVNRTETNRMLTYAYPIPANGTAAYGTVLFQVKEQTLTSLIENLLGDFNGSVFILDSKNQLMANRSKGVRIQPEEITALLDRDRSEPIRNIMIGDQRFSMIEVTSEQTSWSMMMMMPTDQFLGRVIEKKTFIFWLFICLLIAGLAIILAFSLMHYRPIRRLRQVLGSFEPNGRIGGSASRSNELKWISDTLETAMEDHRDLVHQIKVQRPYVRDQFVHRLLKGDYRSGEELDQILNSLQMPLTGGYFFVLLVSMHHCPTLPAAKRIQLQQYLEVGQEQGTIRLGVEMMPNKVFAVIVQFKAEGELKQDQREIAMNMIQAISDRFGFSPSIALGRVYEQIQHMNRSYVEASAAQEYELKSSAGSCLIFEDIVHWQEDSTWYPAEEQMRFIQGLKQGDRQVALDSLQSMMRGISQKERSLLLLKCMCSDIINTVYKTVSVMKVGDFYKSIQEALMFVTLAEFDEKLKRLVEEICEAVEQNRENKNKGLRDQVLAYIHEQFQSYDLSLEKVAEHFGLSVSFLSRFIKDQTGSTFTHYTGMLRLEEIKKELKTTNSPIKDIIVRNGYVGVSNFIEKFRRAEGMTPSEYRKLNSM